jgi:hypothetical protein
LPYRRSRSGNALLLSTGTAVTICCERSSDDTGL